MANNKSTKEFMDMMEAWFSKLPALPKDVNEIIVKITPWVALIFGIFGVLGSVAVFGASAVLAPINALSGGVTGMGQASGGMVWALLALLSSALMVAAFPGTNKRKMNGWTLLFYSKVVGV